MNTQLIGVVLLALIVASNFIDFKSLLDKSSKPNEPSKNDSLEQSTEDLVVKPDFPIDYTCNNSLFCAVKKWEELKKYCEALGLKQASSKLDEIFPLLVLKEDKNV
jgi:hypothetical protein